MTFPTKDDLLAGLAVVRENICAYSGGRTCDCKYGPKKGEMGSSEHTGCPEVSTAHDLLKMLTWDEYEALVRRTRGRATNAIAYGSDVPGAHAALDRAGVRQNATLPVLSLSARLREMGAAMERGTRAEGSEGRLTIRIGDGLLPKLWQSYHHDLTSLASLISFAKRHVHGPWFVDLEPEEAASLWVALDVATQHQLRLARPKDAPPGFMFSYCGVDVCEAQP